MAREILPVDSPFLLRRGQALRGEAFGTVVMPKGLVDGEVQLVELSVLFVIQELAFLVDEPSFSAPILIFLNIRM